MSVIGLILVGGFGGGVGEGWGVWCGSDNGEDLFVPWMASGGKSGMDGGAVSRIGPIVDMLCFNHCICQCKYNEGCDADRCKALELYFGRAGWPQ